MFEPNQTLAILGGVSITYGQVAAGIAASVLVLLITITILAWRAGRRNLPFDAQSLAREQALELRLADMAGQLRHFAEASASRENHLSRTLDQRLDLVTKRTGDSLSLLNERLAVIDRAQKNITELTTRVVGLQDILSNKQSRGAFGQARMEAIIRDGLPMDAYRMQGTLSNGMRPDCLVDLPETGLKLVIDAKFPLEAFNALKAGRDDMEIRAAAQRLRQDVGKHIRDIAQKYLIAGETHDTAIMFVPSESLYADLYEHFEDVIQRAHRSRVIIASPNIMMLVVQTLQAVFKDVRMREQTGLIKGEVSAILEDVGRLQDRVLDLQKHFGQASTDIDKILISSDKISKRGLKIEQMDLQAPEALTPPVPRLAAGE
ncbi:DNA recombination protein RmuC [Rhodoligotrophos appendicifer]|uniref:DNA recombination protein RmuC n=1 Tax=Rhodoligotrophos appendicifer TaxID=987056 RepID=UPI00117DD47F|nr:DNA recombination protein RmuC [Rhodoligotrophos appendicifer]